MKQYVASLAGVSPYFQSRSYDREIRRLPKEGPDAYEERTWRNRTHVDKDGQIVIPAESIQASIRYGAAYLSEKIPGRGSEKWTKHFASGLLVTAGIVLPQRRENVQGQWLHLNSNGTANSGKRVWRCMPFVQKWAGDVTIHVLDDLITDDVLRRVIEHAGQFVGIGQNRPQVGGTRGRYQLVELVAAGAVTQRLAAE